MNFSLQLNLWRQMILSVVVLTVFALQSEAELQPTQIHLLPYLMTGYDVFCMAELDFGEWHCVLP